LCIRNTLFIKPDEMKKTIELIAIVLLLTKFSQAQEVISSKGSSYSTEAINIDFTVGEVFSETLNSRFRVIDNLVISSWYQLQQLLRSYWYEIMSTRLYF